jgi:hypothetical protein
MASKVTRSRLARVLLYAAALACGATLLNYSSLLPAFADEGPFAGFAGRWSGTGTVRVRSADKQNAERTRCTATYRLRGSHGVDLQLECRSDSYNVDLSGEFDADDSGQLNGRWTEHSRNVGGTAIGTVHGGTIQLHIESSAFAADLSLVTRGQRQSINLDSHGAGQIVTGSITLQRS